MFGFRTRTRPAGRKGMFQMSRVLYRVGRACFAHRWLVVVTWLLVIFAARGGTTVTSPANAAAISQVLSKAAAAPQVAAVVPPDKSHLVTKDGKTAIGTVEYKVSAADLDSGTLDALSSIA